MADNSEKTTILKYYNHHILISFGDKKYAYNETIKKFGKDPTDNALHPQQSGWKEAPDHHTGVAPRHREAALKSKLTETLRVPMSEPEMKDEIWTIKAMITKLNKEFDLVWAQFQSIPPQISNAKYDRECARIERERDGLMQRMKDLIAASKTEQAREFGRQAARDGKMLAPAQDKHVLELMAGNEVGNPENIPLMNAWKEGWAQEIAERNKPAGTMKYLKGVK